MSRVNHSVACVSIKVCVIAMLWLAPAWSLAADLRVVGVVANSGESGATRVTFSGPAATGMGPVIDPSQTLWERAGESQLNRYALDGRLLASFTLTEPAGRNDHLTLVGRQLLMNIRTSLFVLPLDAVSGSTAQRVPDLHVDVMSPSQWQGRVAIYQQQTKQLSWFDPASGDIEAIAVAASGIYNLFVDVDGTVYGFSGDKVYAWKQGQAVAGFPKEFHGERPQKFDDHWYAHGWHGTIHRMNERFEPEPGVVLGGASGSFIGFLPASADLNNGRGMAKVRDQLFAVTGMDGIVQLLAWDEERSRFQIVRRLGAMASLQGLALDSAGTIWTARGSWRWDASAEQPATVGDKEADLHAQPVVLQGKTLCLLKKHYSYVQLANGPLIDASGWSHLDTPGIKDFQLHDSVSGAAAVPDGEQYLMVVAQRDGRAFELRITTEGRLRTMPEEITMAELENCTSLAWLEDALYAGGEGKLVRYQRDSQDRWQPVSRQDDFAGEVYVHSDGQRMVISDTAGGAVIVKDKSGVEVARLESLQQPTHVAISGDRVVIYESGQQRLVKATLAAAATARPIVVRPAPAASEPFARPVDIDFQDLGRPGGIPFELAVLPDRSGLTLSIRTAAEPAVELQLGVANNQQAYVLTAAQADTHPLDGSLTQYDFRLPAGEWSQLRFAATVKLPMQQERFGFLDGRAIHHSFADDPALWAAFDLQDYREQVNARRQEIRVTFEQPVAGATTIVIEDEAGHRVRNLVSARRFTAGRQTVVWDGLDESGRLVSPGSFRWRGITHPGIEPQYLMNFANGGEGTVAAWGPNHSTLQQAAANSKYVFFAAPVTEGGWALMALDAEGNFVQGYEHQHGYGIQHDAIAADENYLYCAQDGFTWGGTNADTKNPRWTSTWDLTIVRYDIASGKMVPFAGQQRAITVDTIEVGPGSKHPDLKDFNLGGLAVADGKLYVGVRDKQAVWVLDAETGKRLDAIEMPGVRHLAAGQDLYAATADSVVRLRDGKRIVDAETMDISGIAVAGDPETAVDGSILLSDLNSHQVHRFDLNGQALGVVGTAGGPYKGAYDPDRMVRPMGLVLGPAGKLWVTENRWNPKRILAWDLKQNRVVYEKFGMPHYGGDGSGFDPENPRRWIGLGCFWDVDIAQGTARPTHILSLEEGHFGNYHPHGYRFFREAGRTFVCARGKIALISEVLPDGTLHDIVGVAGTHHFAYGCNWEPPQAYIDAFYAKWPEKQQQANPERSGQDQPWSRRGMGVLWVDRNGDGQAQQDEFDFCGDDIHFGDAAWGHLQTSLTLRMPMAAQQQVKVITIKPQGMLANGVPDYPTLDEAIAKAMPISLTPGNKRSGVPTVLDRFGRFLFNSDPEMNAYDIAGDGKHLWSYPNQWSNVHGSHDAPLPQSGVLQGTLGILGIAPLDDHSDVFFLNGNHGRCFLLSSDGLYLGEAFVDVRVSYLKNEYRLGGEIFGGSFERSSTDGKYLVQIGHGPYRIYELNGLDEVQRLEGSFQVTAEQITAAQQQQLRQSALQQVARQAKLPGKIQWDKAGKFPVEVELDADAEMLHLTYRVEDASPWINNGRDWKSLFATGDTVDLQIAADRNADPNRRSPVEGDKRLLVGSYEGQPIAVLYEHRKPGSTNSVEFTSPWRAETVDSVQRLERAKITVETRRGGYQVQLAVPLADLGIQPQAGQTYRADFGVTYGDAEGTDTNLRSYWSNQSTGLTDDIPGEIMLTPSLWGEVTFGR